MHNSLTSNWLVKDKIISQKIIAYINWLMEKMIFILKNILHTPITCLNEKKKYLLKLPHTLSWLIDNIIFIKDLAQPNWLVMDNILSKKSLTYPNWLVDQMVFIKTYPWRKKKIFIKSLFTQIDWFLKWYTLKIQIDICSF
jgi:hypothetical protein